MTVVKPQMKAIERLVYYYLQNLDERIIREKLGNLFPNNLDNILQSLNRETAQYNKILFPNNLSDPRNASNVSWYDMEDKNLAINIKYGYESSANSRIRDLTRDSVIGINEFNIQNQLLAPENKI